VPDANLAGSDRHSDALADEARRGEARLRHDGTE
jgi:hypothetical protein